MCFKDSCLWKHFSFFITLVALPANIFKTQNTTSDLQTSGSNSKGYVSLISW